MQKPPFNCYSVTTFVNVIEIHAQRLCEAGSGCRRHGAGERIAIECRHGLTLRMRKQRVHLSEADEVALQEQSTKRAVGQRLRVSSMCDKRSDIIIIGRGDERSSGRIQDS